MSDETPEERLRDEVTEFLRRWDDPETYRRIPTIDALRAALTVRSEPRPDALDAFTRQNAAAMRDRLDHGARKFGALSWRTEPYDDIDNLNRLRRAVEHLRAARMQYRDETVDATEVHKRAADVANQAFMFADPERRTETPRETAAREKREGL